LTCQICIVWMSWNLWVEGLWGCRYMKVWQLTSDNGFNVLLKFEAIQKWVIQSSLVRTDWSKRARKGMSSLRVSMGIPSLGLTHACAFIRLVSSIVDEALCVMPHCKKQFDNVHKICSANILKLKMTTAIYSDLLFIQHLLLSFLQSIARIFKDLARMYFLASLQWCFYERLYFEVNTHTHTHTHTYSQSLYYNTRKFCISSSLY